MKTSKSDLYTFHLQEVPYSQRKDKDYPAYKITKIVPVDSFDKSESINTERIYEDSFERRQKQRENRIRKREKERAQKKAIRQIIAITTAVSGISAAVLGILGKDGNNTADQNIDAGLNNSPYIDSYEGTTYEDVINDLNIEINEPDTTQEILEEIFAENPDVENAYNNLSETIERFSEELGENAIPLIKDRVAVLGNGRVDVLDVLKVLHIESRGRIYDPENPDKIIKSSQSDATGAFQLKPDTVDYINYYFKLEGTPDELDVMNPYDNLDACILYLRLINSMREDDINSGKQLATGNNIKHAMVWGYHDGPWSEEISNYAQQYIEQFDELSNIERYAEVVDYLLQE